MNQRAKPLAILSILAALLVASALAAATVPSQTTIREKLTITGEVAAVDVAARRIVIRGPLGGETSGRVEDDVKNLDQVQVGDLVSIVYSEAIALSASKPGEPNPLFTGGETETAKPGERPALAATEQTKRTVTVVSVDPDKRSVVLQGEDGTLFPVEVERPEFARKLQQLRAGDKIDVVYTEALIVAVTPAVAGQKAGTAYEVSTLIVDRAEVVKRAGNTLLLRDERGRALTVTVDPDSKFLLDGEQVTVDKLQPGTKLTRTALRVLKVEED